MTRIVCQASDKPARITFVWSAGAASFEPIHIEGNELSDLRNVATSVRQRLAAGQEPGDLGGRLFAQLFPGPLGAEIAGWLRDVDGRGEVESLEVSSDAPGEIPWTAVDDPQRPGIWGRRLALSGGHRVHPLRSFPDLVEPKLLAVLHPALEPALADEVMASLSARQTPIVHSRDELLARLQSELPDVLWIVAPANDAGWRLDQGVLTADDVAQALARNVPGNPHPLIVSSAFGEANISALREALPGLVTSEVALAEGPAIALGRAFLTAFLDDRRPLGAALRQVRERVPGPASLAWTAYAPPQVGVRSADDVSAAPTPTIHPLPAEPFHPLRPLEREDRALLLGREDDILACAAMLDRADASALWIHGKASVGKASLLRAGLIPFLEEETGGFVAWRERTAAAGPETEAKQPTLSARVGRDFCGSIAQGLLAFCAKPLQFVTPTGRTVTIDLPALLGEFAPIVSTAIREGTEGATPAAIAEGAPPPPAEKPIVENAIRSYWTRLDADPAILERMLERITRPLPFELVLAFEQGDDLVALPGDSDKSAERRAVAGRLLDVLGRTSARVKTIVTVRTEFFAQVQDVMRDASARQAWQDHFLPELDEQTLNDILIAPTVIEPLSYSNQNPAAKYAFGFEPGVVDDVLSKIRKVARSGHVSRLSLVQTVGAGLFDLSRRRSLPAIRPADVKKLRVDQAMSDLVRGKLRSAVRGTSRGVQGLLDRLMVKHDSGIRTRNLLSQRSLQEKWKDPQPLKQVVDRLYQAGLVDVQVMAEDGVEGRYIGPPQDSFEPLDADRETDVSRKTYARSRVVDTLFVMIPLALLGMALTYWLVNRRYKDHFPPELLDQLRTDIQDKDVSLRMIRLSAYHGMISRADQALDRGDTLQARQLLLSAMPDPGDPRAADPRTTDLRGFEWYLLWKKSQMETKNLSGHTVGVRTLSLSANDELLASGDELGKVLLWNLKQGGELGATLAGLKQPVQAVAISADGAWVAGCDGGRDVPIWPTTVGNEQPEETTPKSRADVKNAKAVAFAGAGLLAIAADDGIVLWDIAAGKIKATLKDHAAPVLALVSDEEGKFVSVSADQAILWNADGKKAAAVKLKDATIDAVAFAKPNLLIAATKKSGGDGVVYVWDLKDGSTPTIRAKQAGTIRAVASIGDDQIATGGDDMTIRIHDLAAGKEIGRLYGHLSRVRGLVAGKGGRLASCGSDPAIKLWSAGPGHPIRESIPAHDSVQALALNPNGQILASGGHDGVIKLWSTLTAENTGEIKAGGPVAALTFAPKMDDKTMILAAAVGNDVLRWSVSIGKTAFEVKELPALKKHTDRVLCLRFSPDAKFLASGSRDKSAILWDVKGDQPKHVLANSAPITAIDVPFPLIISGDEAGSLRIWDAENGRPFEPYRTHGLAVTGIDVMNQRVISGGFLSSSLDQTLRHSARTQERESFGVVTTIRSFAEPVTAFVQGSGFVALAGGGGSVAIADVSIDEPRLVFRAHPGRINAMVLSREQALLVTGGRRRHDPRRPLRAATRLRAREVPHLPAAAAGQGRRRLVTEPPVPDPSPPTPAALLDESTLTLDGLGLPIRRPGSVVELGDLVRQSAGAALYPFGGRTHLGLGNPPTKPGIAVDLRGIKSVVDFPARDMTITVETGIPMAELRTLLATENLRLPIDVPRPDEATLGGAIAVDVSGPRRFGFGTLRDYVIGISAVNDEGAEFKAGGRVVKNVAGYDLCKLLVGSLGTLGIITQVTLKLRPLTEERALIAIPTDAAGLDHLVDKAMASRTRPVSLDVVNRAVGREIPDSSLAEEAWTVLVGYEGNTDLVRWQMQQLVLELGCSHAVDARIGNTSAPVERALVEGLAWPGATLTLRASTLPSRVVALLKALDGGEARLHAHAGNGIVVGHYGDMPLEQATALVRRWRELAGGPVVVVRCPTEWKRTLDVWGPPRGDAVLMREVRRRFDPRGIFNPGRFV